MAYCNWSGPKISYNVDSMTILVSLRINNCNENQNDGAAVNNNQKIIKTNSSSTYCIVSKLKVKWFFDWMKLI